MHIHLIIIIIISYDRVFFKTYTWAIIAKIRKMSLKSGNHKKQFSIHEVLTFTQLAAHVS